jgi:hypothetical protein
MSRTNISNLPLELVVHAMGLLSTPQDLWALINTSKFYHHAFQCSRTTILVAVIQNVMPYESIHYAATVCKAGEIAKSWWVNSPGAYFVEARTEFLENYRQGRQSGDYFSQNDDLLLSMYRLWWILNHFIVRFVRRAFDIARQTLPTTDNHADLSLSMIELDRLQSSFYLHKTFWRLFPAFIEYGEHQSVSSDLTISTEAHKFLTPFLPWEKGMLLSVHEYLYEFTKDILNDTRGYLVR